MKTKLYRYLENLNACKEALEWIEENNINDPQVAWDTCPDGRWLLWVAIKHTGQPWWPTHKDITLASCDCAETALHLVSADVDRHMAEIETARRLTNVDNLGLYAVDSAYITSCALFNYVADALEFLGCDHKKAFADMAVIIRKHLYIGEVNYAK